jgi:hypothetical protein
VTTQAPVRFELHEPVVCAGRKGTIVDAYPDADKYTVELFDEDGDTVDIVDCTSRQLERPKRASYGRTFT